jgi:hypothetical protein
MYCGDTAKTIVMPSACFDREMCRMLQLRAIPLQRSAVHADSPPIVLIADRQGKQSDLEVML